jgi:adenosine deaminase
MHADRIGHGYRVVDDDSVMDRLNKSRMHFEMCPMSSYCTGSIKLDTGYDMHPLHR